MNRNKYISIIVTFGAALVVVLFQARKHASVEWGS